MASPCAPSGTPVGEHGPGAAPPYALVVGHGRSGTNWLLSTLDASERTHCRNEPDGIEGGALSGLPTGWVDPPDADAFGPQWDRALDRIGRTLGQTDHPPLVDKVFLYAWARRLGAYDRLLLSPRLRRALRALEPRFSLHPWEFELPRWLGRPEQLSKALTVVKLVQVPGWTRWVLQHRPDVPVLHIVRHPGGFLNSWTNRWLAKRDEQAVARANHRRLEIVRAAEPEWGARFGDIDAMSTQETELWFWRYAAETIHARGARCGAYRLVVFEDLAQRTEEIVAEIYERCALPFTEGVRAQVADLAARSGAIAGAWRTKLDRHDQACVERVLDGCPLTELWR